ncbi:MAG: carboxymuconolactone decarboxylase family protein [Geminicoccaceae bacterium]|nr:carboxymuconolactone decarboxylase family protein [Geminicoccaceae bacterium]MCB9943350.1 carboxymuconolactone decarboxylase family protein [Geminicoccaceae bacterium]
MATVRLLGQDEVEGDAKAVFDEIKATRNVDDVNNFWKAMANDPAAMRQFWERMKAVMGKGALDPLTKELVYVAISIANSCEYCIHSHTAAARAKGLTQEQYNEFLAVVGLASQGNAMVTAMKVPVDEQFQV